MSRHKRIARHLARRRAAGGGAIVHRDIKPDNVDRDAELAQWRAVWATPDVEVRR